MAHSAITYVLFEWCMLPLSWSLSSKSVFAFACCFLGHASAPWNMELILNLNSSWACGLKYVSMYFSSDAVTQQVHMIPGVLVKRINFHSRKWLIRISTYIMLWRILGCNSRMPNSGWFWTLLKLRMFWIKNAKVLTCETVGFFFFLES